MSRLALTVGGTVAGAVVGSLVPGVGTALGASLGSMAGTLAGMVLFPTPNTSTTSTGARLDDLTVMSSAYGVPIPMGFGTFRMSGNCIWSPGLQEHKHVDTQTSGGKGGGTQSQTGITYAYSASFAVDMGEGVIKDVLTIWADSKIIFDKTSAVPMNVSVPGLVGNNAGVTYQGTLTTGSGSTAQKSGLIFRFYPGDETQRPDPAIEADPRIAAGHAPAFRGHAYIVFENLALADYGNRIPQISMLVTYEDVAVSPYQTAKSITATNGLDPGITSGALLADTSRNVFYTTSHAAGGPYLIAYTASTLTQFRAVPIPILDDSVFGLGPDGFIYAGGPTYGTCQCIVKYSADTFQEVSRSFLPSTFSLGIFTLGFDFDSKFTTVMHGCGFVSCLGANGMKVAMMSTSFVGGQLIAFNTDDMSILWIDGWSEARVVLETGVSSIIPYVSTAERGSSYITTITSSAYRIYSADMGASASVSLTGSVRETVNFSVSLLATVTVQDVADAAGYAGTYTTGTFNSAIVDPTDGGLVTSVDISGGGTVFFKWRPDLLAISWAVNAGGTLDYPTWPGGSHGVLTTGVFRWARGTTIFTLSLAHGTVTKFTYGHDLGLQGFAQAYIAALDVLLVVPSTPLTAPSGYSGILVAALLSAGGGAGTTAASIITRIAGKCGLDPSDIDVTDLVGDVISGYFLARPSTGKDAIFPILQLLAADVAETNDVLLFKKRGNSPVRTIPQAELCAPTSRSADDEWLVDTRTQEPDLPVALTVSFIDSALAYQQNAVLIQRRFSPVQATAAKSVPNITLPIVLTREQARAAGEKALYSLWAERVSEAWATSWQHIDLDPTDVVQIDLDNGLVATPRIGRTDLGADWTLEMSGNLQDAGSYIASAQAAPGPIVPISQRMPTTTRARLFVLDIPLLQDTDDTGGTSSNVYVAASGYGLGWPGCVLYGSADNVTYTAITQLYTAVSWGLTWVALPTVADPFSWDVRTQLKVTFTQESGLSSVTDDDVLTSGKNAFAVQNSDGNWEIIQAVNVVQNADGTFTLSRLLRGRRGTWAFALNHTTSDLVVSLSRNGSVDAFKLATAALGATRYYKAVTIGKLLESTDPQPTVCVGNDLKPYMPTNFTATKNMGGDIVLTWIRSTRLNGEQRDGTDTVPLAEAAESYEVDVLSGPGGTVKQTLTATTPTATYLAADITADFGTAPTVLTLKPYQMSAVVGRGLSREVSVEVE